MTSVLSSRTLCVAAVATVLALLISPGGVAGQPAADGFTALTLNIWHDQGDWPRRHGLILEGLQALRPDVVCLQEVLQKPGLPNQAKTLAEGLGYAVAFASVDGAGAAKRYGNAILTRHPVLEKNERRLRPFNDYRVALHVRLAVAGRPVNAYCTHLHYSGESAGTEVRSAQIRDLLAFVKATSGEAPVIVAGDFNAPPDAEELKLLEPLLADTYAAAHAEQAGARPTTLNPHAGHAPRFIDYLFHSPDLQPTSAEVILDTPTADSTWASDHFGVLARFVFDARAADR